MQYHEYISQYNARREREIQLAEKYSQNPDECRVKNLYKSGSQPNPKKSPQEIWEILIGLLLVAAIIAFALWF